MPTEAPPEELSFVERMTKGFTDRGSLAPVPPPPPPAPVIPPPAAQPAPAPVAAPAPAASPVPSFSAPATPPANPAAAPVDDIEDEPAASPRSSQWAKLKASREEWRQKAVDYEAKLKNVTPATNPVELETLRKEREALAKSNEDLSKRLQQFAVEKHPQFEAHFSGRTKQVTDFVKAYGGAEGERLAQLIAMPSSEQRNHLLDEIVATLPPTSQSAVGSALMQMDAIQRERAAAIADSEKNFQTIQQQQAAQAEASAKQFNAVFDNTLSEAQKHLAVFQRRDGDEAWNREVDGSVQLARNIISGKLAPEEISKAAIWSAAAPRLLASLNASNQEVANLRAQLAKMEATTPKPPGGGSGQPNAAPDAADANLSLGEAIAKRAAMRR